MAPVIGDILIALFVRPTADNFHWVLAVRTPTGFAKFHATNGYGSIWGYHSEIASDETRFRFLTSKKLAAFVKIGRMPESGLTVEELDVLLGQIPMATNSRNGGRSVPFDCKIWIQMALQSLHEAGYVHCPNAKSAIAECEAFGQERANHVRLADTAGSWAYFTSQYSS